MLSKEKKAFIRARLQLAQQLLEESDGFQGRNGYCFEGDKPFHPRHEREALVIYLLLTCFDKLGQSNNNPKPFDEWLKSTKKECVEERNEVLKLPPEEGIQSAIKLYEKYQEIYGVRSAFSRGVLNLPESAKEQLFSSVRLSFNPDDGQHGQNVSTRPNPIKDKPLEQKLKLDYLFKKRNKFTHKLEQYHSTSTPALSEQGAKEGSSWCVIFKQSQPSYMGVHQECKPCQNEGTYFYTTSNWPFVLFESLYEALGLEFNRTDIKLKFIVMVFSEDDSLVTTYHNVEHRYLTDRETFLKMAEG